MEAILIYIIIGIAVTGILELRLNRTSDKMNWIERVVTILTYPAILFKLYLQATERATITGYLVAVWIAYQILNQL